MHIFYKKEEETERGEKKITVSVCVVSVELTSDLAEYGKEESAESILCVEGIQCVCMCVCKCVCVLWPVCVLVSVWVVRRESKGIGCV